MDRTIEVEHRLDELRRCAALIRAERAREAQRPSLGAFSGLRLALGRRLVAAGHALQDGIASTARPTAN